MLPGARQALLAGTALLLTLLGACASDNAALGWGGTHRVVMANDKAVMYEYDPVLNGLDKAVAAAQAYCGERGKSAVPTVSGRDGVFPTQTFECR
jgi:hypothetical protein